MKAIRELLAGAASLAAALIIIGLFIAVVLFGGLILTLLGGVITALVIIGVTALGVREVFFEGDP